MTEDLSNVVIATYDHNNQLPFMVKKIPVNLSIRMWDLTMGCQHRWYYKETTYPIGQVNRKLKYVSRSYKVCIKSPCTSISASSAVLAVHGLLIQTLCKEAQTESSSQCVLSDHFFADLDQ